jgi:SNF2 family DNA or RNA helicase
MATSDSPVRLPCIASATAPDWRVARHIHPDQIKTTVYHGPTRERLSTDLQNYDVVMTTYETLRSEWENNGPLVSSRWLRVVLDEGR